jgi:hypothetical protein
MIEYWMQNGEAALMERTRGSTRITRTNVKSILKPLFRQDGSNTSLSSLMFSMLLSRNLDELTKKIYDSLQKSQGKRPCSFCGEEKASILKGWIYPFVIVKQKFPNIYSEGNIESLNICPICAFKSVASYSNLYYSRQGDYLSLVQLHCKDASSLRKFRKAALEGSVIKHWFYNWKPKKDATYYPHELLFCILAEIALKLRRGSADLDADLGAWIYGFNAGGRKKIYTETRLVTNLLPIIMALREFIVDIGRNNFNFFFHRLRKEGSGNRVTPDLFVWRNDFVKTLLDSKAIDWITLENIVMYNLQNDQSIPFINLFLRTFLNGLNMPEKELYDSASRQGYVLGKRFLSEDTAKRLKAEVYELRRSRTPEEFLDKVNMIQLQTETTIDDRLFRDNLELFKKLKVFFIIGMTNAMFSRETKSKEKSS